MLYLLHGRYDSYLSWTRSTDVEELSRRSGVLVVMPEAGRAGFYSDWRIGPGRETFHTRELHRVWPLLIGSLHCQQPQPRRIATTGPR